MFCRVGYDGSSALDFFTHNQAACGNQACRNPRIGKGKGVDAKSFDQVCQDEEFPSHPYDLQKGVIAFLNECAISPQQVQPG